MGQTFSKIDDSLRDFVDQQQMFFVATAPLSGDAHINLSPKGLDSLRILDEHTLAFADLVGSGVESIAHVKENGRIVIMFCAFEGRPLIVRFHGKGTVVEPGDEEFASLVQLFPAFDALRSIIKIRCERISDSCGYGVPLYSYVEQRTQLPRWAKSKGEEGVQQYIREKNAQSIDGLPGAKID